VLLLRRRLHLQVQTKDGKIMRVVNEDTVLLCGRGRFGFGVVEVRRPPQNPAHQGKRRLPGSHLGGGPGPGGRQRLQGNIDEAGAGAVYGVGSPRATNEANYLFQKFFREGLATNNLDNPARLHYVKAIKALAQVFG
jgi:formate dehydrogenase (NADP+) alpha subunit